jgi:hypothetical protein
VGALSESFTLNDNSLNLSPATQTIALSGTGVSSITLTPSNATLAAGTVGVAYGGVTFTATGGTAPYTYTYTGTLPPGLTLSASGLLSGTPTTAGGPYSFTVVATDSESVTGSNTYSLTINMGTATVTLGSLAQTYTGSPLAATATTSPTELAVGFTYTGTNGTPYGPSSTPPAGAGSYTVVGTVSNANYAGTATATLVIAKAPATVTLGNLAQTYNGSPLAATESTNPTELAVGLTYAGANGTTYGPSSTPPTGAGSYTVVGTVSNANYAGTATATLVIAKEPATVTLGNLTQTYTGSPLAATSTTSPTGLTVSLTYTGTNGTTYGPSSTPPTLSGSYTVVGTVSSANYSGTGTATLVISGGTATVTLGNLAQVYTGSPLAATATTSPAGLTVAFTYTGNNGTTYGPTSTPPTAAGSYTVVGTVSSANNNATASGTLVIAKAPATVTLGDLAQTYTGSPLAATATTTTTGLTVGLKYTGSNGTTYGPSSTPPTSAGSYTVVGTVTNANYSGAASGTMVIGQVASATSVSSSANPVLAQTALTFTATVSARLGTPTGTVTFLDGTTPFGQASLTGHTASLITSSLVIGSHTITAVYSGDTDFAGSASSPLTQSILDFSLAPTSGTGGGGGTPVTTQTTNPGGTATYPLTIVPTAGISFPAPILLTVAGMPLGATAVITPSPWTQLTSTSWSFPAQTPLGPLSLAIQLPSPVAHLDPRSRSDRELPAMVFALLLLPFARRLRALRKPLWGTISLLLLAVAAMGAMAALGGCGATSGLFANQAKTYTVTVTATSGTLSHATSLTLTVR